MIGIFVKNWREIGRPVGVWAFMYHLCSRAVDALTAGRCRFVIYRIYVQPLVDDASPLRAGYEITEIFTGDVRETLGDRPAHVLAARRKLGYRCFCLSFKGEDVGLAWFATDGQYLEDEFRLNFLLDPANRLVWDFDVFIEEKWRAGRAFQQLWKGASQKLRQEGFENTASRIHLNNINSILSHERLGATVNCRVAILTALGWQISLQSQPRVLRRMVAGQYADVPIRQH